MHWLDIELFAYGTTRNWAAFLRIRKDVLLRVIDIVEHAGAALAFPSQTLYLRRDRPPADWRPQDAEARVREWWEKGLMRFPDVSCEQTERVRCSVVFPPLGSTQRGYAPPDRAR